MSGIRDKRLYKKSRHYLVMQEELCCHHSYFILHGFSLLTRIRVIEDRIRLLHSYILTIFRQKDI